MHRCGDSNFGEDELLRQGIVKSDLSLGSSWGSKEWRSKSDVTRDIFVLFGLGHVFDKIMDSLKVTETVCENSDLFTKIFAQF